MKRTLQQLLLLGLTALAAGAAAASTITFFETDNFGGRRFTADQTVSNFAKIGYNDRAQSAIIQDGAWEICVDADFRGGCQVLGPGRYDNLGGFAGRISSARPVDGYIGPSAGAGGGAYITFFETDNFGGRRFSADQTVSNFAKTGYNDRAQSLVVQDGQWEICVDADFRGACQVVGPGRYPDLGGFGGRISSARPVEGRSSGDGRGNWAGGPRDGRGGGPRAMLYEGPNLSGRSFEINNETMTNLANTGFNDRASSLRVLRGYWIFCSDSDFRGECRTFGPGDYPTLPWGLENRISSGRRISNDYPYNQNPTWQRGPGPQSSLDGSYRTQQ